VRKIEVRRELENTLFTIEILSEVDSAVEFIVEQKRAVKGNLLR
jgi:hypothetical protein